MSCRDFSFQYTVEGPEVEEIVSSIFHTVLFHRTLPTLDFKGGAVSYNSYLGTRDVDCENFELAYVCVNSEKLISRVANAVNTFANNLRAEAVSAGGEARGTINLEFAIHRKGTWGLGSEPSVWERWTVAVCIKHIPPAERDHQRHPLEDQLRSDLLSILEQVNSPSSYMPSLGSSQAETEHIVEFSMPDISPYRFNINYATNSNQLRLGVGAAARRILKYA
ncbi:unnamed protein product [Calicophoron daubneyi]|uniref:Autophagy-related protein 101 n=1 Tax=Calicophoron daubneyi TaxID=300641 RepID=A0AAV2TNS1_CALDB